MSGGGKKASHNYSDICTDINSLSRAAVQLYLPFGSNLLTPIILKPQGSFRDTPSFAFIHRENIVLSLQSQSPQHPQPQLAIEHNLHLLKLPQALKNRLDIIIPVYPDLIKVATAMLKASNARPKRTIVELDMGSVDEVGKVKKLKK